MTRRNVIFINTDGKTYMTEEYNGDKAEFTMFGMTDTCDKNWVDIMSEFQDCFSLADFFETDRRCQAYYHAGIGKSPYHSPEEVDLTNLLDPTCVFVVAAGSLPKTGMGHIAEFLKQHISRLEDSSASVDVMERAYTKQILEELVEIPEAQN